MTERSEKIALFDMDGTLVDYDLGIQQSMSLLASPDEPPFTGVPREDAPAYLKARAALIKSSIDWWTNLPKLKLGFDIWEVAESLGYQRMILTQGPRLFPSAWMGKKLWIDRYLGENTDITITRDKGLVYGKVLVDDWPEYIERWLKWRPRGIVIMPDSAANKGFKHSQVIRYDGSNLEQIIDIMGNEK